MPSLIMLGDLMLGRLINQSISHLEYRSLWGNTLPLLQNKNAIVSANLECAITNHTENPYPKVFNFALSPSNIHPLLQGHFKFVSLANNHTMDFGEPGLEETMQVLEKAHIAYAGVGFGKEDASKPALVCNDDTNIAFLSYSDHPTEWKATDTQKLGMNYINPNAYNRSEIAQHVQRAKVLAEIVVCFIHWGPNYSWEPSRNIQKLAHDFIDFGTSCVFGHSAHHVQGIEVYKGAPIIYGAGGGIDDYALDANYRNDLSFLYQWHIKEKKLELIPTRISHVWREGIDSDGPPYFSYVNVVQGEDATWLRGTMKRLSSMYETEFTDVNGRMVVSL